MNSKGYVSPELFAGRIVSKGKIESLPFSLPKGGLFTVYVRPKEEVQNIDVLINARLYQDNEISPMPVALHFWTQAVIAELGETEGLLGDYDVYWGSGQFIEL